MLYTAVCISKRSAPTACITPEVEPMYVCYAFTYLTIACCDLEWRLVTIRTYFTYHFVSEHAVFVHIIRPTEINKSPARTSIGNPINARARVLLNLPT